MRSVLRFLVLLPALGLPIGCGTTEQGCFDDRSCDTGQRCVLPAAGELGVCGPCDATETPYNGLDDDCDPRTRDLDLDRDGQNAIDSPISPGLDCDDNDRDVLSGGTEVCNDGKDNDCDGMTDERDCADVTAPIIRIISPSAGQTLSGQAVLRVQIDDDVGAAELAFFASGLERARVSLEPTPSRTEELILDTTTMPDGRTPLRFEATDLKGQVATASIDVTIDNRSPPLVQILNPAEGFSYGGYLTATASVSDATGVASVEFWFDGQLNTRLTAPPWMARIETATLADGQHDIEVRAADTRGNPTSKRVTFAIDNTPPYTQFVSPTNGQTVSGIVSLTITATDAAGVLEVRTSSLSAGPSPFSLVVDTNLLPNGPLTVVAEGEDLSIIDDGMSPGNVSSATITVTINNIDPAPVVTFVTPLSMDGVLNQTALEVGVQSLVGNTIADVSFTVAGRPAGAIATAPYIVNYDFRTHTGTVAVMATATDVLGNQGSATVVVQVVPKPTFRLPTATGNIGPIGTAGFTTGDVTGDGVLDVIAAGQNLVVFTGTITPGGTWAAINPVSLGAEGLLDVRLADVDGDTVDDIIGLKADSFRVYLGQGNGTFGAPTVTMVPQAGMRALAVGDLDGDLDPDVVVVGGNTTGVVGYTFLRGTTGFTLGQVLGGDTGVSDVTLADIDADTDLDVIVGRTTTSVLTIFLNGGPGNFGAGRDTPTSAPPARVKVLDMNGSGRLDVVIQAAGVLQIMPVISTAPFTIVAGAIVGNAGGAQSFALGQVVGNNLPDIVVATPTANGMEVIQGGALTATGYQTDQIYMVARAFSNVQLADLDNDGDLDVLGTSATSNTLVACRNLGAGEFSATITLNAPSLLDANNNPVPLVPTALATGNVVGTIDDELIVNMTGAQVPAQMLVYQRQGTAMNIVSAAGLPPSIANPSLLAVGGASPISGYSYIVLGENGPVTMGQSTMLFIESVPPQLLSTGLTVDYASHVAIGNVDGDSGFEAVLALDPPGTATDGSVVIDLDLTQILGPFNSGSGAGTVAIGNLDSDPTGQNDYAVANTGTENITVQLFSGGGYSSTAYNAPAGLGSITTGLVNQDPYLDIVGLSGTGVFVMEGDPAFGFRTPLTFPAGQAPARVTGGDYNGDGLYDIFVLNSQNVASLLLARPQGGFFPPVTYEMGLGPVDFVSVDFDRDGRLDLLSINAGQPSIMLLYNDAGTP